MISKISTIAGILAAVVTSTSIAQGLPSGTFTSYGANWELPPTAFTEPQARPLGGNAMHYVASRSTHNAVNGKGYFSAVFFPSGALQIDGLNNVEFDVYFPGLANCSGGAPRVGVVVESADGSAQAQYYIYLTDPDVCPAGEWEVVDMLDATTTSWTTSAGSSKTQAQAHDDAVAEFGDDYKVTRVRLQFDNGAEEVWFDRYVVNDNSFIEPIMDGSMDPQQLSQLPHRDTLTEAVTDMLLSNSPINGYFQSYGAHWALPPTFFSDLGARPLAGHAMHHIPSESEVGYFSAVFFPVTDMQISELATLEFDAWVPHGVGCSSNPYIVLAVEDPANPAATPNEETQIRIRLNGSPEVCSSGDWKRINMLRSQDTTWYLTHFGNRTTNQDGAHEAAVAELGANYRITRVRINYAGEEVAWFDRFVVNKNNMIEPINDMSEDMQQIDPLHYANSLEVGVGELLAGTPVGVTGRFEARNIEWAVQDPSKGESMHFAPDIRPEPINFMSASFFPTGDVRLNDIDRISFSYLYDMEECKSEYAAPSITIVLDTPDKTRVYVRGTVAKNRCKVGDWLSVTPTATDTTSWYAHDITNNDRITSTVNSLAAIHDQVASQQKYAQYRVYAVRVSESGDDVNMWLDNVRVNNMNFQERILDLNPDLDTQVPPELAPVTEPVVEVLRGFGLF